MSKVIKKNKGTVSHFDDDSFEFTPYGKGESVYDQSHKWEPVSWATFPRLNVTSNIRNIVTKEMILSKNINAYSCVCHRNLLTLYRYS